MAKKNIFDLYNEQNPPASSTDETKVARRDEDAERDKVVQKEQKQEQEQKQKQEQKQEQEQKQNANVGDEKKEEPVYAGNNDKGGD